MAAKDMTLLDFANAEFARHLEALEGHIPLLVDAPWKGPAPIGRHLTTAERAILRPGMQFVGEFPNAHDAHEALHDILAGRLDGGLWPTSDQPASDELC